MKYFFDTEFHEHEAGIDFISIGIIREDGETLYAEAPTNFDNLSPWLQDNVWPHLKQNRLHGGDNTFFATPQDIGQIIRKWIGDDENPQFYAYYASYDWVVMCRLFGRMIDLPANFPMYPYDLKVMMDERGLDQVWKRKHCPEPEHQAHDAMADALWNFDLFQKLSEIPSNNQIHRPKTV